LQWTSNHYSVGALLHQRAPGDCNNALRQSSGAAFQNDWLTWVDESSRRVYGLPRKLRNIPNVGRAARQF